MDCRILVIGLVRIMLLEVCLDLISIFFGIICNASLVQFVLN